MREPSRYFVFKDEKLERERMRVKIGYCKINIEVHAINRKHFIKTFGLQQQQKDSI